MASIVLGTVGTALGGAVGGPIGATIGGNLGSALGGAFSGSGTFRSIESPRLSDLGVQTSTYGKMIPLVYGTVRIAGNVIWSTPIRETATTTTRSAGGKGGSAKTTQSNTSYSYSVTLAIAICEGPIDAVLHVWADAKQLDMSQGTYRMYKGTESQLPDSAITARQGAGKTPAYRGLAYVVVENFPLGEYGNRIPNFTFEVRKRAQPGEPESNGLESMIRAVNLIPGSGEFVYDTRAQYKLHAENIEGSFIQRGVRTILNMHNAEGVSNAVLALNQLEDTLPNAGWVGLVATWFGTSLDAGDCVIKPGVEYAAGSTTTPDVWQVAGHYRDTAHLITQVDGVPRYGGTPDDASLLRLIANIKARGMKVMFYPMFFMDVAGKPWRGHVTGSAAEVAAFFTKTNGYNAFIAHYAHLIAGEVDAFVIGSELVGLTKVASSAGVYPAVNALVSLAATVKGIVGAGTKVTYAADWSEYHHTDGGWYNLDPLWASPHIDLVGIDAYFPLTDALQQGYDLAAVKAGWTSGEGYDWYYTDPARTTKAPLAAPYAWKNIEWWWKNAHVNPNGSTTAWMPESKKIWFTEYGFPSVDGATNQPNVFYDPTSSDSGFPRFSRGRVDFRAQRLGLTATEQQWKDSPMVERMFIWTWDARPFPYWPDLADIWADGAAWKTGHWIQGKLGISGLAAIVADLCLKAGMSPEEIDVTRLDALVEGCVVSTPSTAREVLEQLMAGFLFDAVESDGLLKFVPRGGGIAKTVQAHQLVPAPGQEGRVTLVQRRKQEVELPRQVNVLYINRSANYMQGHQFAARQVCRSQERHTVSLPVVFSDQGAKVLAEQMLYTAWMERTGYELYLPVAFAALEPTDLVQVEHEGVSHQIRICEVMQSRPGLLRLRGVADDAATYDVYLPPAVAETGILPMPPVGETLLRLMDLPAFPDDDLQQGVVRVAVAGLDAGWRGAVTYRSDDGGAEYGLIASTGAASIMGVALAALPAGKHAVMDEVNTLEVSLVGEAELESVSLPALLNGANSCVLGEEILQYQYAELLDTGKYRLSSLLRGRLGTEHAIGSHSAGEPCLFLNGYVERVPVSTGLIGLPRVYKAVSVGSTLGATEAQNFTYAGRAFRPYSPVHLRAERDGAGNITFHWVRRGRGGGEWRDYIDVPLGENAERYEVEILQGATVKRTLAVLSPQASYAAGQQIADFGSVQASVSIRVYQLSGIIGRGYPAVGEV